MNYIVGNKGVANYLKMSLIRSIYERKLTSMSEIPIKDIKNINNIKNVKDVKDIKDIRNILDVKNIRNFKNPNDIKGIKDVQKRSDSKPSVKIIDFPFPPIPTIFNSSKFLVPDPQTSQSDSSENQSSSSQPGLLEVQPSSSVLSQVRSLLSICSSAQKPPSMLSQIEPPSSKISPHQLPPFTMPQIHPPQSVLSLFQLSNIDLPNFQLSEPHPSGFSNTSDLLKKWNMENREFSESNNYIKGALFESITLDLFDTGEFNVTGKPGGGPDGGIDFKGFATQGDETVSVIGQCKNYNRKLSTTPLADLIEVLEKNTLKTIDGTTRLPHGFMVTTFDPSDSVLKLFMNSPFPLSWITIPRPHAGLENPYQIENHTIYPPTSIYHNISAVQLWSDVMDLESKRLHSELTSLLGPGWESTHNMDIEGFVIAGDKVFAIEVGDKVSAIEAGDKISAVKA